MRTRRRPRLKGSCCPLPLSGANCVRSPGQRNGRRLAAEPQKALRRSYSPPEPREKHDATCPGVAATRVSIKQTVKEWWEKGRWLHQKAEGHHVHSRVLDTCCSCKTIERPIWIQAASGSATCNQDLPRVWPVIRPGTRASNTTAQDRKRRWGEGPRPPGSTRPGCLVDAVGRGVLCAEGDRAVANQARKTPPEDLVRRFHCYPVTVTTLLRAPNHTSRTSLLVRVAMEPVLSSPIKHAENICPLDRWCGHVAVRVPRSR